MCDGSITGVKKGHGMCYPVNEMVNMKDPLLIGKSSPCCSGSRFFLSLSE